MFRINLYFLKLKNTFTQRKYYISILICNIGGDFYIRGGVDLPWADFRSPFVFWGLNPCNSWRNNCVDNVYTI